jgi:AraC-like DNA-binding protein
VFAGLPFVTGFERIVHHGVSVRVELGRWLHVDISIHIDIPVDVGHDSAVAVRPERTMRLQAANDMRCLAIKFYGHQLESHGFQLSGCRQHFEAGPDGRLSARSPETAALLARAARLWSDIARADASLASAIALTEREDELMTAFVLAAQRGDVRAEDNRAGQRALRLAEDYLDARLTRPVSRADLAAAAGVSIRTLSRAFTRRWGTGPMGFLKARRMQAAYQDLLGAQQGQTTVGEIASRYGFSQFGRFSIEYRAAFGESPSQTLRH